MIDSIMPSLRLLIIACIALLTSPTVLGQATFDTYPVNWDNVPNTPTGKKNLTANCICDLTAHSCDTGCCCDPDCIPPLTNSTRVRGACLPEGPPKETLDYCVPDAFVKRVRGRSRAACHAVLCMLGHCTRAHAGVQQAAAGSAGVG